MNSDAVVRGVDAYSRACRTSPQIERIGRKQTGVSLYGWGVKPAKELHIPSTSELTLAVHLSGARRVRVFTESGVSQRFSRPGCITLIPRDQRVSYLTDGEVLFATGHIPVAAAQSLNCEAGERLLSLQECLFAMHDEYAVSCVQALMKVSTDTSSSAQGYVAALLDSLIWHLAGIVERGDAESLRLAQWQPTSAGNSREPDFDSVLALIDQRLGESLSIAAMADCAGVGRTTFSEKFTQQFGCSPHRFIVQRRVDRAKQKLREGKQSITSIAHELGFSSSSHFASTFNNLTGMSPISFR